MSADSFCPVRTDAPVVVVGAGRPGLAAARALHELDVPVVVLEADDRPAGSWPRYYDSLRLFSPAAYSLIPGVVVPGRLGATIPSRDDVADYLERQAAALPVEVHTDTRAASVRQEGREFVVVADDEREYRAAGVVAASGSFSNPHWSSRWWLGSATPRPPSGSPRSSPLH
jgi:putative flavoprotein involved in K+ transport